MSQWLRDFIQAKPGREKIKTVFNLTISKCKALDLLNDLIVCCNGDDHSVIEVRLSALEEFMNSHDLNYQKALFDFFCDYMPHWQCAQEFSYQNMKCFLQKLSSSYIFLQPPAKISIHAPRFKIFRARIEPEMTAAVMKRGMKCIIHPENEAVRRNKFGVNICKVCTITLGHALKKVMITKDTTKEEIISYLQKKKVEKENRKLTKQ